MHSPPKQERSQLSTRRLLDAAAHLISEVGYDRASLAAIGARAGYSRGLVTRRFGNKENMLDWLVQSMTSSHVEAIALYPDGSAGGDGIGQMFDTTIEALERAPEAMWALYALEFEGLKQIPTLHDRMVDIHSKLRADATGLVQRNVESGSIEISVDAPVIAALLVSVIRGAAYQWLLDPDGFDMVGAMKAFKHFFLEALRPR